MKNKHVYLYLFDDCWVPPSQLLFLNFLCDVLVTESVGDSSPHSSWKSKSGLLCTINFSSLFSIGLFILNILSFHLIKKWFLNLIKNIRSLVLQKFSLITCGFFIFLFFFFWTWLAEEILNIFLGSFYNIFEKFMEY